MCTIYVYKHFIYLTRNYFHFQCFRYNFQYKYNYNFYLRIYLIHMNLILMHILNCSQIQIMVININAMLICFQQNLYLI